MVDDEPDALEILQVHVQALGYRPLFAFDGAHAIAMARAETPALVILDLMLPGVDGFDVCRVLRRESATTNTPIIIVSARTDEMDRVVSFELGADDYVTKPFSTRELILRTRKLLARARGHRVGERECLRFSDFILDVDSHTVAVDGCNVELTATEFRLLALLARKEGIVIERRDLLRDVWKYSSGVNSRTVDSHVRRLRIKLGSAGRRLETVRGLGYRFESKSTESERNGR